MQPFYVNYLSNLQELHDEIRRIVAELPQDALDWTPGPEINSLSVLIIHLSGAERYWIGDVAAGEPSGRDREAEFKIKGLSKETLLQHLNESEAYLQQVLETFTFQELDATRISPRNGRQVSVGWALGHALKHTALHLGHMQITRQLWERQ